MSYIEETLMQGERIVHLTRRHKISCVGPGACVFSGLAAGLAAALSGHGLAAAAVTLACLAFASPAWVRYWSGQYGVTNRRVFMTAGWPGRKSLETALGKVGVITVKQSVWGRLFDYGTVIVTGFGGAKEELHLIPAPLEFRKKIFEQVTAPKAK